jgi:hypothetical protein
MMEPKFSIANVELKQDPNIDPAAKPLPLSRPGKILLGDTNLWPSVDSGKQYPTTPPFKDL